MQDIKAIESAYRAAMELHKNRKYLYLFRGTDNKYYAVNYDVFNNELNSFLLLFDISNKGGQHKRSEDNEHIEIWFEVDEEFYSLAANTFSLPEAIKKLGVEIVFKHPFDETLLANDLEAATTAKELRERWKFFDDLGEDD